MLTRRCFSLGLAAGLMLVLSGCGGTCSNNEEFYVPLFAVNAAPDVGENVDFYAEGSRFAAAVEYLELEGGSEYRVRDTLFESRNADDDDLLQDDRYRPLTDHRTYVVLGGRAGEYFQRFLYENIALPEAGKARVSALHNLRTVGDVDIWLYPVGTARPATPSFQDVSYGEKIDFVAINAGNYTMEITPENSTEILLEATGEALEGASYIVLATPQAVNTELGAIVALKVR